MYNCVKVISETFENEGQEIEALTVILDGRMKRIFEIIKEEKGHQSSVDLLQEVIAIGIENIKR